MPRSLEQWLGDPLPTGVVSARVELDVLADRLEVLGLHKEAAEVRDIVETHLIRRPAIYKSPRISSQHVTPRLAKQIVAYKRANPDLTYMEIGQHFRVSLARVSEALRGKRK